MKYCPHCGEAVRDDANYCTSCGKTIYHDFEDTHSYDLRDEDFESNEERAERLNRTKNNEEAKGLGIAIIIFAWIGVASTLLGATFHNFLWYGLVYEFEYIDALFQYVEFIPLLWEIPLAIYATSKVKKKERFTPGFAIISLFFLNFIAGILMFAYKPEGEINF